MTIHFIAVFENGSLRPRQPLALPEGAEVHVIVLTDVEQPAAEQKSTAEALEEIAALPLEADDQGFSGADHDQMLYGAKRPK